MLPVDPSPATPQAAAIALGPFVLQRPIGAGGMGEVWQGVHAEEHVPVAVKVIGASWARHDGHRRAFQREVRAVAGLAHPGIVAVVDDGVVDATAALRSGGRLAEGSPYLAMEYLPRGSLEGLLPALDWPLVQVIVRGTLAALAHAHARGVIHCDLKPGNVLLSGWSEVAIKLTDFGVAHALGLDEEEGEGAASSAGTPAYMAPEQLLGRTRDLGPWTDLYALGCTVWEMCAGALPFMAPDLPRLAAMHLYEAPGPFRPVFEVPREIEGWLRRLLAKRPRGRFARAADALAAFRRLPGGDGEVAVRWSSVAARTEALAERSPTRPGRGTAPDPTRRFALLPARTDAGMDPRAATAMPPAEAVGALDGTVLAVEVAAGTRAYGAPAPSHEAVRGAIAPPAGEGGTVVARGPGDMVRGAGVAAEGGGETVVARGPGDMVRGAGAAAAAVGGTVVARGPGDMVRGAGAGSAGGGDMARGPGQEAAPREPEVGGTVVAHGPGDMFPRTGLEEPAREDTAPQAAVELALGRTVAAGAAVEGPALAGSDAGRGTDAIAVELPFPPSWRLPHDASASRPLHGAGLGLVRVRELPLVGREAERDRLWAALARVRAEGRPRLVLVRGASGVGKSRLVEWTAARAHELGAAEVLRAAHGPFGGPAEGLPRMLAHHLRCVGLTGDETFARCLATLDVDGDGDAASRLEAAALTELLCPGDDGPGRPRVRLQEARERQHVLAGHLARVGAARPAIVWIDDAQWGSAALELVRFCLKRGEAGPRALFVATVRDDLLGERPAEAALLGELSGLAGAETLSLGPLPEEQHQALVEELLGLERGLVEAIVARTGGNPLFSVQLVGDWIARGLLRPGRGGFALRDGAEVDLPDDMHALWRRRIEGLLARHFPGEVGEAARASLELAAAIGQEIDAAAWAQACALAGIAAPTELGLVLVRERLATATPAGFAFAHGMLRESLERMAEEAGRSAAHHRTCARLLRQLGAARTPGRVEEVARHLIAAGDLREALGPLLETSYQMQLSGQYARAEAALVQHAAVADRLGLPPHDLERLRARMQGAWLAWMRGGEGGDRGAAEVAAIMEMARAHGHDEVLGEALRWRGLVARFERRFAESLAALAEAAECFARAGDGEGQARTALAQAVSLRAIGQTDEAEARLAEAERLARARGLLVLLPRVLGNLAEIALQRGDWPEAQVRFARALEAAEQVGDRKALALTSGGAGDLAFVTDALAAAEAHWRRAEAVFASLGSRYLGGIRLNLAALELLRGRASAAEPLRAATTGRDPLQAALGHLALAVVAGSPGAVEEHLAGAEVQLARAGEGRRVLVRLADRAAEAAERRGWATPAARARALARGLEARLDAGEEGERGGAPAGS